MNAGSVIVLGHRGMLGHIVGQFLRAKGCRVITSDQRYTGAPFDPLLHDVRESGCTWVVNAIGMIKQKSNDLSQLYLINTVFPHHLLQALRPNQRLIHASTDCVFSGRRGSYAQGDPKDAEDVYGLSKALGEGISSDRRVVVMRVSIIGPEAGSSWGLFSWFLRQSRPVDGYTNHYWNGITTLEWAEAALEVIRGVAPIDHGLAQLASPDRVSKYELLCLLREVWQTAHSVEPVAKGEAVDRTLRPTWERPGLRTQLQRLRAWMARD